MTDEKQVEVECPSCHHKFWHKIGDEIKKVAETAAETAIDIVAGSTAMGGDE